MLHDRACPFYEPEETGLYCAECGEPILKSDEYVKIGQKKYHKECLTVDNLLKIFSLDVAEWED